ncbi:tRNA threonylcarbamoyladenosine dehydratase [Prevotella sp.]|uniref:tRNA threonylcarbamoyladenosine dehydratase n=1 Tax=Prevotella sp. TaxID=59823 RepID=UPI002E76E8FD|nr:tRNA threonylcarbamoyladenosine dehydratase [Prevotella sp.]MEE0670988.1 tRNA threonylcarbamoyladenosine dehydratase [Prevotella sp.]
MNVDKDIFMRAELLLGSDVMEQIASKRVIVFGVGGVGSWCVECLVRSGIHRLTIVDCDKVCASNVNRQLMATTKTIGRAKVEALKERLLEINPNCEITALQKMYGEETHEEFGLDQYDYIIDCIDSLKDKVSLIMRACETHAVFFSSMGAALKMDPTKIQVAEFWKVRGCPLGSALRKRMKKSGLKPAHKFKCVYSEELLENRGSNPNSETNLIVKAQINGSMAHITSIFGLTIAGLVLNDIYRKVVNEENIEKVEP